MIRLPEHDERVTFRLSAEDRAAAEKVAQRYDWTLSDVLRESVRIYLEADAEINCNTA